MARERCLLTGTRPEGSAVPGLSGHMEIGWHQSLQNEKRLL